MEFLSSLAEWVCTPFGLKANGAPPGPQQTNKLSPPATRRMQRACVHHVIRSWTVRCKDPALVRMDLPNLLTAKNLVPFPGTGRVCPGAKVPKVG